MRQTIFLILISLSCSIHAQAEIPLDVHCEPAHAWDTGYSVKIAKLDDNYIGQLAANTIYAQIPKYRDSIDIREVTESSDDSKCAVRVTSACDTGLSFSIQISTDGSAILESVDDQPVKETVKDMVCLLSDLFQQAMVELCQEQQSPEF